MVDRETMELGRRIVEEDTENLLERQHVPDMAAWNTRRTNIAPANIAKIIELKGKMNQREIGKMFGISYQHVSVIQRGKLATQ